MPARPDCEITSRDRTIPIASIACPLATAARKTEVSCQVAHLTNYHLVLLELREDGFRSET